MKTLEQKIEIMQACLAGKPVECRPTPMGERERAGIRVHPHRNTTDWQETPQTVPHFNWAHFEYRVKTESIDTLAREHSIHIDDLRAVACLAKTQQRDGCGDTVLTEWYTGDGTELTVIVHDDGSVDYGCQHFTWAQVEAYALEKKFW